MQADLSPADYLQAAMSFPPPAELELVELPEGSNCVLSGQPITRGYRVMDVVTDATTEFLDCFRGQVHGHISEAAGRCFKTANPSAKHLVNGRPTANPCAKSHLAVQLGSGGICYLSPAFDPTTAEKNGTLPWSRVIREWWALYAGLPCYVLITPDFKRRLWPYSRAGVLGGRTPVYALNKDYDLDGQFHVSWPQLIEHLDLVEGVLAYGFSKRAVRESLPGAPNSAMERAGERMLGEHGEVPGADRAAWKRRCLAAGRTLAVGLEKDLRPLRERVEFKLAVMTAVRSDT